MDDDKKNKINELGFKEWELKKIKQIKEKIVANNLNLQKNK